MTKQRELVHRILCEYGHLTAEQIFTFAKQEMPEIAFATIYNNLKRLCDAGIIRRVRVSEGADFYDRIFFAVFSHLNLLLFSKSNFQVTILPLCNFLFINRIVFIFALSKRK